MGQPLFTYSKLVLAVTHVAFFEVLISQVGKVFNIERLPYLFWPKWVVFRNSLCRGQVASNTRFPSSTPKSFPPCKISSKLDCRLQSYELFCPENLTLPSPFKLIILSLLLWVHKIFAWWTLKKKFSLKLSKSNHNIIIITDKTGWNCVIVKLQLRGNY